MVSTICVGSCYYYDHENLCHYYLPRSMLGRSEDVVVPQSANPVPNSRMKAVPSPAKVSVVDISGEKATMTSPRGQECHLPRSRGPQPCSSHPEATVGRGEALPGQTEPADKEAMNVRKAKADPAKSRAKRRSQRTKT